jgi:hypothetical protein
VYLVFEMNRNSHSVIASEAKQSMSPSKERMDCFASLAMTLIGRRVGKRRTADATAMHGARPFASVDRAVTSLHSGENQRGRSHLAAPGGGNIDDRHDRS